MKLLAELPAYPVTMNTNAFSIACERVCYTVPTLNQLFTGIPACTWQIVTVWQLGAYPINVIFIVKVIIYLNFSDGKVSIYLNFYDDNKINLI